MKTYASKHGTLTVADNGIAFAVGECSQGFIRGVQVPPYLVKKPAEQINPRELLCVKNADVRREFVRKVGIDRIIEAFDAKVVDRQGDYELLMLDIGDQRPRPYLSMKNPSVEGARHVEGVHPNARTVKEALAWRNGRDDAPAQLT